MLADGIDTFIEVGPHPTLLTSITETAGRATPQTLPSLRRLEPERVSMMTAFAQLWCAGHPIVWERLFPASSYQRVTVPFYPWQRERHWIDIAPGTAPRASSAGVQADVPDDWVLLPAWQPARATTARASRRWIVLASPEDESGPEIAARLGARPEDVVVSLDDLPAAFAASPEVANLVIAIGPGDARAPLTLLDSAQRVQDCLDSGGASTSRVWCVTRGAQMLDGDVPPEHAPEHAAAWGAGRVIGHEHPEWWGGLIDLPGTPAPADIDSLVQQLKGGDEPQVAIRRGERFELRIRPASSQPGTNPTAWPTDAAYLITGGFGGIALHVARAMVRNGARRFVLVSRSPLPPRTEWAAHSSETLVGRRIAAVRELERAGASIHVYTADVGNMAQLQAVLDHYRSEGWPEIKGVIHAAGVVDSRLVDKMDHATMERVLAAKLDGALALDRLLPELDLFVLFSSMTAFWPAPGLVNYAAANAGLDGLAARRRARGQHALSIQWGPWINTGLWSADVAARNESAFATTGLGSLTPEQGTALFSRVLQRSEPVVAVVPLDWSVFAPARHAHDVPLESPHESKHQPAGAVGTHDRTLPVERDTIESVVRDALGAVIRRPAAQLDARRPFGAMGLDSLMSLELRNRLEALVGRALPATLAWNYPTIERLVAHLDGMLFGAAGIETGAPESFQLPQLAVDFADGDVASMTDDEALRALRGQR
jgi:acyl transferase domain-containing protein/acyl carrier protein